jgi:hypothetical protein
MDGDRWQDIRLITVIDLAEITGFEDALKTLPLYFH